MNKLLQKIIFLLICTTIFVSCAKKNAEKNIPLLDEKNIPHAWYYFTSNSFEKTTLPQNAPSVLERPWTEAVRISSAAVVPSGTDSGEYTAYAVVNRAGILALSPSQAKLFCDISLFSQDTADTLVFSNGTPVFYFYQSTFFNESIVSVSAKSAYNATTVSNARPFLVEFNPHAKIFYPLVSYSNLNLSESDQITGYFWNGTTWACSAKKTVDSRVTFSYFSWEPVVPLTELSPALSSTQFTFSPLTEDKYRELNTPSLFNGAPRELKNLLSTIPPEFCFYVTYHDDSGTSPVSFYQPGNDLSPVNAHAVLAKRAGYRAAVFADGTTYLKRDSDDATTTAFRLPKLPAGYTYGDFAIAGNTLYISWEESNFYKTGRAGFLTVDINAILEKTE